MQTANLELCKELFELSGWEPEYTDTNHWWTLLHETPYTTQATLAIRSMYPDNYCPAYFIANSLKHLEEEIADILEVKAIRDVQDLTTPNSLERKI